MTYTHQQFVEMTSDHKWAFGVTDYRSAVVFILGEGTWRYERFWYGVLVSLIIVYSAFISWKFGWGNVIGVPIGMWMAAVGRPNFNIIDVIFLFLVGAVGSGIASLLSWAPNPWLLPIGFAPFILSGTHKFSVLERMGKVLRESPEKYDDFQKSGNLLLMRVS